MNSISVIGAGSWGTVLANLLALKGSQVRLWAYEKETVEAIAKYRENKPFMPGLALSPNITPTNSLSEAVGAAAYVILVVPTQFIRRILEKAAPLIGKDAVVITAAKGVERGTLKTASAIIRQFTGNEIAALSGPSFADEVAAKRPTAVTLAIAAHSTHVHIIQDMFYTEYFRVYTNEDIVGVELGGALKNVIAIASGICDGLGLGLNARAALITRGLSEIIRLGVALGAKENTFSGLSGLGDLVLTCTGNLSRNYTVGLRLGRGETPAEILSDMKTVAEGVETSASAYELACRTGVEMPIVEQVYKVIHESRNPDAAVRELMSRELKEEFRHG
ncbi:MAG: NAD(P)-dependent glycerol-3-phosphate dehydrogenase [Candidatus Magnetominusculus sp. LBB02]|nr:NAD(P)-dependent glycerol-3-phosphate dehydrogenase [Candidatus Magnetominusculus sp. LBB02]